jgi:hypothetical protein
VLPQTLLTFEYANDLSQVPSIHWRAVALGPLVHPRPDTHDAESLLLGLLLGVGTRRPNEYVVVRVGCHPPPQRDTLAEDSCELPAQRVRPSFAELQPLRKR